MPAFVAKMNATASRLGMDDSHFADASGVNPGSESTASDLLKVAALDMDDPTFASMVTMSSITLPVAGTISTYTPLLGLQGVIGVKSGFTSAGRWRRRARGGPHRAREVGAAVGRGDRADRPGGAGPGGTARPGAGRCAEPAHRLHPRAVGGPGGGPRQPGRQHARRHDLVVGLHAHLARRHATRVFVPARHIANQARRGTRVGTVVVTVGAQRVEVPVRLTGDIPPRTLLQRLF